MGKAGHLGAESFAARETGADTTHVTAEALSPALRANRQCLLWTVLAAKETTIPDHRWATDGTPVQCLIRLREKGETIRWQPVSPTLMHHLLSHGEQRGAGRPDDQVLRYRTGRPRSTRADRRRPLPVARLIGARKRSTVYGLTAVDARGRVADHMVTRALGWQPGDPLSFRVTDNLIVVTATDGGQIAVSSQGRVHLPAAARHACGITAGDRVLLAAEPVDGVLLVHPLATLDAMVARLNDQARVGDVA